MSGPAVYFRELHRLWLQIRDLQEHLGRIPYQIKAQQNRVKQQEEAAAGEQETIKRLKVTAHEKEVTLKGKHGQIAKYEKQLDKAESKKEYDALKNEIAQARQMCQQLEDEILTAIAESEERAGGLPALQQAVARAHEDYARFEEQTRQRQADLTSQMQEARARVGEVESQLPETVRPQYQRILAALGPDAFARVQGRVCTACSTEITAQSSTDLMMNGLVICRSCERMLYLPDQAIPRQD